MKRMFRGQMHIARSGRVMGIGGQRHRAGAAAVTFPWPSASADLDFIRRQYWWNGATRLESDFATLVLNGATWGAQGLDVSTCTVNPSITITLATLGITMPPCVYGIAGHYLSTPGAVKPVLQFDDGTQTERFALNATNPPLQLQTVDGSVVQSGQSPGVVASANRFGMAFSAQLNEVLAAGNGTGSAADVVATMPTVTTLRLGCGTVAATFAPAILSRLVIFSAVKTQAEIIQLSIDMRDSS